MKKLGARFWSVLIIFGLMGQIAWVVENMYFNVFLKIFCKGNHFSPLIIIFPQKKY